MRPTPKSGAFTSPLTIPDHAAIGLTAGDYAVGGDHYYAVPGRYMPTHDNLLDLAHLGFLHQSTIAAEGPSDAPEERKGRAGSSQCADRRHRVR